jgi:hypothetical protein
LGIFCPISGGFGRIRKSNRNLGEIGSAGPSKDAFRPEPDQDAFRPT